MLTFHAQINLKLTAIFRQISVQTQHLSHGYYGYVKPQSHIHESWRRTATNRHSWRNSPRSFWFFHIRCSSLCFGNTFVAYRQGRRGATNVLNCSKQSWLHREFLISVVYSSIFVLHRYISLDFVEGRSASVVVPVSSDCHVERRQEIIWCKLTNNQGKLRLLYHLQGSF